MDLLTPLQFLAAPVTVPRFEDCLFTVLGILWGLEYAIKAARWGLGKLLNLIESRWS